MKRILAFAIAILAMTACNQRTNPFLEEWNTPYGIPPFDQIQITDYLPALQEGIKAHDAEVQAIIDNPEAPTFDNVIAAYDASGDLLAKVSGVLFNLAETDNSDALEKVVEEATTLVAQHDNDLTFNKALFAKVEAVNKQKDALGLTREQEMVLDKIYRSFADNGIALDEAGQARMKEINTELSTLSNRFGNYLLKENNAFKAKFGISISEYTDAMTTEEDRAKREEMFRAYSNRGNNGGETDTKEIILNILKLKQEKAKLLGYPNPAAHILSDKMAKTPEAVDAFLANIFKYAVAQAKAEVKEMQKEMNLDIEAGKVEKGATIQPWDWFYYAEKVRKAKYALDEETTKPYFQMENVRQGVFNNASKLYGLQFEKIADAPLYNPDVEVFKVSDADGSLIGVLTTDYFPRESKRGGAWMNNIRDQYVTLDGQMVRPIIVNVGNFNKPTADTPSLLSLDNVETMFHEFGHALHGLLSQCHYRTVSGTAVARDFVELPSQINENWAFQKEVLAGYAKHYQTGESIPDELIAKIAAAQTYGQGFINTELLAASLLDMDYHSIAVKQAINANDFEQMHLNAIGLIPEIISRYKSPYFQHIFTTGYDAGYYSYTWTAILDHDAFAAFVESGDLYNPELAKKFRHILESGNTEDPMQMYINFRGKEPSVTPLLKDRGLI